MSLLASSRSRPRPEFRARSAVVRAVSAARPRRRCPVPDGRRCADAEVAPEVCTPSGRPRPPVPPVCSRSSTGDDISDRGPQTLVAGALAFDTFAMWSTIVITTAVLLVSLLTDQFIRDTPNDGPEIYALYLVAAAGGIVMASANDLIVLFLGPRDVVAGAVRASPPRTGAVMRRPSRASSTSCSAGSPRRSSSTASPSCTAVPARPTSV